jgi:hypothetical protein
MRYLLASALAMCMLVQVQPAHANTLRCKGKLVQEGDTRFEVLAKCGEPDFVENITETARAPTRLGGTYVVGTVEREVWTYNRAPGKFPAILRFDGTRLKSIEFIKTPR